MTTSTSRHPYDIETEIETMEILKAQNKKIHELLEEVKRKNDLLVRVQTDNQKYLTIIKENDIYKENLNFQINQLGEKFKALDKDSRDRVAQLTEDNMKIRKSEKSLSQDVADKERILTEYKAVVERYEEQIRGLRGEIVEKNTTINSLESERNELANKIKNYVLQIELLSQDMEVIRKEHSQKFKFTSDIKNKLEDKADELLVILKQQDSELKTVTDKCVKLEQDNVSLHNSNKKYKSEMDELIKHIQDIKDEILKYKELDVKFKDCEEFIIHQAEQLEAERKKVEEYSETIKKLREEIIMVKDGYTGDRSPDYLNQMLKSKNEDIRNLNNEITSLKVTINEFDLQRKEWDNEVCSYNTFLYGYLGTLMQWIETYLGTAINESCNISIPDLKFDFRKQKLINNKLKSKMEKCQGSIVLTHNRIKVQFDSLDRSSRELRDENQSLTDERAQIIQENNDLKTEREGLIEELESTKERFEKVMRELENVSKTMDGIKEIRSELQGMNKQYLDQIAYEVKAINDEIMRSTKLTKYSEMLPLSQRTDLVKLH
jgi:chromosome segregation ATPase